MKPLIYFLALAASITFSSPASAQTVNPFSDVPANSWAYQAVAELAQEGLIKGYPDGLFHGDQTITRYEMAQLVARAMAADVSSPKLDRLAAEFADELDTLGIRVKNLETKSDNFKINGEIRLTDYALQHSAGPAYLTHLETIRTRLYMQGKINKNWTYNGVIQNNQNLANDSGDEKTEFLRAFLTGRLGGVGVSAGKQYYRVGSGYAADFTSIEGIFLTYGNKVKATAFGGKAIQTIDTYGYNFLMNNGSSINYDTEGKQKYSYGLHLDYKPDNKWQFTGGYFNTEVNAFSQPLQRNIYTLGIGYRFDKNINLYAEYLKSDKKFRSDFSDDGFGATLTYKQAQYSTPGSWGAYISYFDQAGTTYIDHETELDFPEYGYAGFKGYEIGLNYILAKNIMASISYFDFNGKDLGGLSNQMTWSRVYFTF